MAPGESDSGGPTGSKKGLAFALQAGEEKKSLEAWAFRLRLAQQNMSKQLREK